MLCPWGAPLADNCFPFSSESKEVDAVSYFVSTPSQGACKKKKWRVAAVSYLGVTASPKHFPLELKFRVALKLLMFELVPDSPWQPAPCQSFAE